MQKPTNFSPGQSTDNPSSAANGILFRLKAETGPLHEALENQLDLFRPNLEIGDYVAFLARLYGYYQPWEKGCWPVLNQGAISFLPNRRKTKLLVEDLRHFGTSVEKLPLCDDLPALDTFARSLGSLYVFEGATLGGQILSRYFSDKLGLATAGMSFLRGYEEKTGFMWQSFCSDLCDAALSCSEFTIVESAQATFQSLATWLGERSPRNA